MKPYRTLVYIVLTVLMLSCAMTHSLQRSTPTADIHLPSNGPVETPEVEDVERAVTQMRKISMNGGRDSAYLAEVERDSTGEVTIKGENKLSAGLFVLQIQRPVYDGVLACKFAGLAFGAFDGRCESLVLQQIHGSRTAVYETVIGSANIIQTAAFFRLCCLHGNYVITCNSSHASCATG